MIAVDTSALMAVIQQESEADACARILETESEAVISAGTVAEALIVAGGRGVGEEMAELIARLGLRVVPLSHAAAQRVAESYRRWGKGNHPAALNFGDCFAYQLAKENACPLLYVGKDFDRTDVERVRRR